MDYLQYRKEMMERLANCSFKPYYKWITFNTDNERRVIMFTVVVLNLIINGLPSILFRD